MPPPIRMVSPDGTSTVEVDEETAQSLTDRGYTVQSAAEGVNKAVDTARAEYYSTPSQKVRAAYAGVARGATLGISDAVGRAVGADDTLRGLKEANPELSIAGEIGGSLLTGKLPVLGAASRAGSAIAKTAEGASVLSKIGRAAAGGAVEGVAQGIGSGVSEVSLSDKPLTLESAVSAISSNALFGGVAGGAVGGALKAGGIGLRGVQSKLDDIAAKSAGEVDDATKVALRDEVAAFRKEVKESKVWLATKDSGVEGLSTVGKRTLKADKALDNLLDDPKALVANPQQALRHLRVQASALEEVAAKADELRASLTKQNSVNRLSALEKVTPTLERNRALQAKIEAIATSPAKTSAASLGSNMLGGQAFGLAAGVVGAIPVVGPLLAPIAGAAASKAVTDGVGKMAAKQAARASKAIGTFLDVTAKLPNVAPVLASKALTSVKFGEGKAPKPIDTKKGKPAPKIAAAYKARTDEIKQMTQFGPDGKAMMRPDARQRLATTFDAVRAVDPIAADKMETLAARRMTALADRIPRKPDVMGYSTGPSKWQPSDMQMRGYARFAAAVEDPIGVVERLATGQVTSEDRDAMKTVYPEMYADVQAQIMAKLPTLQKQLPYHRRLALSLFSGIPVDAAMHPRIMEVLQASYADEPGTEGGTQAPVPEPAFGSVKNQEATPSQQRQGATV